MTSAGSELLRRAKLIDAITFVAVVLISPFSVVFSYVVGVPPDAWLRTWLTYVVLFITLAIIVCVAGFGLSTRFRVRAAELMKGTP